MDRLIYLIKISRLTSRIFKKKAEGRRKDNFITSQHAKNKKKDHVKLF